MTDTPVPHESTSPAVLTHSAENTEVTRVTGVTGVVEITERARIPQRAGAAGTAAEAVQPPTEDDDLVIEDLSDAAWPLGTPAICICTVGAE
ncbi:hypothetical protein [Streptomyces melanosporofaciens]|uniref:Uncharacterized protein n=1 Tax=Streptomyces melanosporofaciens TaxID=67327 RepID=A0A1H4NNC1_STRMJ|nr:hypothetical protein [Streptomyces melanosporofaciens]SEB96737.1 hypothetical protein SAMN04490356_2387 [Streptomyces melanosporofaciens]